MLQSLQVNLETYIPILDNSNYFPYFTTRVSAGFPSPCDDYIESKLDLTEYLVKHPAATFYVKACGDSMIGAGISEGDLLVVDKSLNAKSGSIIIAAIDGQFTVKRFIKKNNIVVLQPENSKYSTINITEEMDFRVWGVVTNIIKNCT